MAVYKRVNTRRRRTVRNVLLWLAAILLIFGATVAFGAYLGRRAETAPAPHGFGAASDLAGETAAPIAEHIVHGEYTEPSALTAFDDGGDPYAHASLWLYKDGKCILESYFVSGNPTRGHATPRGIYGLTYKTRNATLSGEGYDSKVKYWMPFNRNVGLHDAPWRSSFGGQIYRSNGSHGCINLPPANAAKIYENVEKNTPVIVY